MTCSCMSSQFPLHAGVTSAKSLQMGLEIPRAPDLRSRLKCGNPGLPSAYRACCRSWVSLGRQWLLVGSLVRHPRSSFLKLGLRITPPHIHKVVILCTMYLKMKEFGNSRCTIQKEAKAPLPAVLDWTGDTGRGIKWLDRFG